MTEARAKRYPESPCVGICRIDERGYCEGCLRTLDEIAAWGSMSESDRETVFARLKEREHGTEH